VSSTPAQHLALKLNTKQRVVNRLSEGVMRSTRAGGSQMNYEDFPPALMAEVQQLFRDECARRGTEPHMEAVLGA
jgi:hypothetical protein